MTLPGKKTIESWFFNTAAVVAGLVLAFSVFNGYSFLWIALRTGLSFLCIFFLGKGLMGLWKRISPPPPKQESNYGSTIDVILGNLNAQGIKTSIAFPNSEDDEEETLAASQITQVQDLLLEANRPIPGQINQDIKSGLQNAGAKAEMAKKMGWGEEQ